MSEKMYCSVCKTDVDPEVYDDGTISYCPICHTGYREVSYEAHMRELADERAVLSEFENETHPYLSAPANKGLQADGAKRPAEMIECGNCGVPRFVHGGVLEACPNCGDDETDLAIWDDVP
jgi:uncharacterized Zn finger protein (UPF0148 family)